MVGLVSGACYALWQQPRAGYQFLRREGSMVYAHVCDLERPPAHKWKNNFLLDCCFNLTGINAGRKSE